MEPPHSLSCIQSVRLFERVQHPDGPRPRRPEPRESAGDDQPRSLASQDLVDNLLTDPGGRHHRSRGAFDLGLAIGYERSGDPKRVNAGDVNVRGVVPSSQLVA